MRNLKGVAATGENKSKAYKDYEMGFWDYWHMRFYFGKEYADAWKKLCKLLAELP